METTIDVKVTQRGVLIPRRMVTAWGDVKEVEIEQRADIIIIKPKLTAPPQREQIMQELRAAGLVEEMPWADLTPPPPERRAYLIDRLSQGGPLSQHILADRDETA